MKTVIKAAIASAAVAFASTSQAQGVHEYCQAVGEFAYEVAMARDEGVSRNKAASVSQSSDMLVVVQNVYGSPGLRPDDAEDESYGMCIDAYTDE